MTPLASGPAPRSSERPPAPEPPETLESLLGDCRRMAARWEVGSGSPADRPSQAAPAPAVPHGITVPAASARAVRAMPDYGA